MSNSEFRINEPREALALPPLPAQAESLRVSACHAFGKVFEFGDVENGTARDVFGETVGVQIEANFDSALGDPSHVVMGDVAMAAIGHADAEWLEGLGLEQFANLFGGNHGWSIMDGLSRFNCRWFISFGIPG